MKSIYLGVLAIVLLSCTAAFWLACGKGTVWMFLGFTAKSVGWSKVVPPSQYSVCATNTVLLFCLQVQFLSRRNMHVFNRNKATIYLSNRLQVCTLHQLRTCVVSFGAGLHLPLRKNHFSPIAQPDRTSWLCSTSPAFWQYLTDKSKWMENLECVLLGGCQGDCCFIL